MFLSFNAAIWLYPKPIDFRKQIDGLVMLIADHLQLNPVSGQLFLFRNRQANKIKMLWWERNGFWLCYKRLEKGRLKFPKITNEAMALTNEQFGWLLSGLDFVRHTLLFVKSANHRIAPPSLWQTF
jgi:transposase